MRKRSLKQSIVKNSFWSFSSSFIARVGGLFFTIVLARFLMPENYGIYSIVLSTVMIFYTFADLGVNETLARYISLAIKKEKTKISSYYKYLLKIKLVLSLCVSLLLIILAYPISAYFFKNDALFLPLLAGSFYIFVLAMEGFYTRLFYPIERVEYLSIRALLTQILRIIAVFFVFYFVASSYQVMWIFFSLILVHTSVLLLILSDLKKLIPELSRPAKARIDKKEIRKFVGFLTIATISGVFFSYVDSIILGFFLLPEFVGYYVAAFSIIAATTSFIAFPNIILLPIFAKVTKLESEKVFNKVFRFLVILAVPSSFGLVVFRKYIINLLYGNSYLPSALPLFFLAFLIVPMACVGTFLPFFSAKGKPQIFAKLIIITGIINIILSLIFIKLLLIISPSWAMTGAAIANLISWTYYFLTAFYISKKQFNLKISFKPLTKPIISSLFMTAILLIFLSFFKDVGIILGIILILFGSSIYFISMVLIKGITKEDLELFRLLIKREKFGSEHKNLKIKKLSN